MLEILFFTNKPGEPDLKFCIHVIHEMHHQHILGGDAAIRLQRETPVPVVFLQ